MKPKRQFQAQDLRTILSLLFFVILAGGGAIFYMGLGIVRDYSEEVNQQLANAEASGQQVEKLQSLKSQLTQSTELVSKAQQLFSTPDKYESQALTDIKNYADAAGVTVASTTFDRNAAHTVTVRLASPTSYSKLITFLTNIESNLPKLQVSSLSLSRSDNGAPDSVKVNEIKINVSVR